MGTSLTGKHDAITQSDGTWTLHSGNQVDAGTGTNRNPLGTSNFSLLPRDPAWMNWSETTQLAQERNSSANLARQDSGQRCTHLGPPALGLLGCIAALLDRRL